MSQLSELEPERVRPLLRGAFGEPYLYFVETASTQDVLARRRPPARRRRRGRAPDGGPRPLGPAAGTTRRRRASSSRCCCGLRPTRPLAQLSLVAGLAVAAALEREAVVPALVKWPNDVLVDGGKVAGILLEAPGTASSAGSGSTSTRRRDDLPPTPRFPATRSGSRRGAGSTGRPSSSRCSPSSSDATDSGSTAAWPGSRTSSSGGTPSVVGAFVVGRPRGHGRGDRARRPAHRRARRGETMLVESGEVELAGA